MKKVRRYRVRCSGTKHTIEFSDGGGVCFVDHEPGFAESVRAEVALVLMSGALPASLPRITDEGCKRVACYFATGHGRFIVGSEEDADERRLHAEMLGVRLARKLRKGRKRRK